MAGRKPGTVADTQVGRPAERAATPSRQRPVKPDQSWRLLWALGLLACFVAALAPGRPATMGAVLELSGAAEASKYAAVRTVQVWLQHAIVTGVADAHASVQATLRESGGGGVLAEGHAQTDESGHFSLILNGSRGPVRMRGGQRLLVASGSGAALDLLLPAAKVEIDETRDVVYGTAIPGATVWVTVDGAEQATAIVAADADGQFEAHLGRQYDIVPGTTGLVRVWRLEEEEFVFPWAAPELRLSHGSAILHGTSTSGLPLTVLLHRSGFTAALTTTVRGPAADVVDHHWSVTLTDPSSLPMPILEGDHVAIEAVDYQLDIEVPALYVEANLVGDIVAGIGPVGLPLTLSVHGARGGGLVRTTSPDPDGHFLLPLAPDWDLEAGDRVQAECRLAGERAVIEAWTEAALLEVSLDEGRVAGYITPASLVTVTLHRPGTGPAASAAGQADEAGWFGLVLRNRDGSAVPPQINDELVLQYDHAATRVAVPLLTVDDTTTDQVVGRAPPESILQLSWLNPLEHPGAAWQGVCEVSSSGTYSAALPTGLAGAAGSRILVSYTDQVGATFRRQWSAPSLRAQLGGSQVSGQVAPGAAVEVIASRGGEPLAAAGATARPDGTFDLVLSDASGLERALAAGDDVRLQAIGPAAGATPLVARVQHQVIAIEASLDEETRRIVGHTAPSRRILVTGQAVDRLPVATNRVMSGADGRFDILVTAPRPAEPLPAGTAITLAVSDAQGQSTFVRLVVPRVELTIGQATVTGLAAPFGPLRGELQRGSMKLATLVTAADTYGVYRGQWRSAEGVPIGLAVGDTLSLTDAAGSEVALVIPPLTAELDPQGRGLHGTAPPHAILEVQVRAPGKPVFRFRMVVSDGGSWSLGERDLPPYVDFGWGEVTFAVVEISVGTGHRIAAIAERAASPTTTPTSVQATPTRTATTTPTGHRQRLPLPYLARLQPAGE